jgi:glycosyltransferase involved in cell wall biosynthesis
MKSRASVIIPTLNRPDLLQEAVRSVLTQTYPPEQIIVVDDGSDDPVQQKIDAMQRSNSLVSVYHLSQNVGASAARNFGLQKASGDFILFLDDDDLLHPKMLESSLYYFLCNPDIDVTCCKCKMFYSPDFQDVSTDPGRTKKRRYSPRRTCLLDRRNAFNLETEPYTEILSTCPPIHSCLVRRRSVGDVRFPTDLKAGEDTFFWLSLAFRGCRFKSNHHIHAYVRRHTANFTLKPEFSQEYIRFLKKLLATGMLRSRRDHFLCHALLFVELLTTKNIKCLKHLTIMLGYLDLLIEYGTEYLVSQRKKRHILNSTRDAVISGIVD